MYDFKSVFKSKGMWTAFIGLVFAALIGAGVLPADFNTVEATAIILGVLSVIFGWTRYQATEQVAINPDKAASR